MTCSRNERLNITAYFEDKIPQERSSTCDAGSNYGSAVNLVELPAVLPFEDVLIEEFVLDSESCPSGEYLPDNEADNNNSFAPTINRPVFDFEEENVEVESGGRSRRDIDNRRKCCGSRASEDNITELSFVDDTAADPNYETGTYNKVLVSISSGKKRSRSRSRSRSIENKRSKSPSNSEKIQCLKCGKSYNKNWYNNHVKTHGDVFNYTCNLCDQKFKVKPYLTRHMKIHERLKVIKCSVCAGVFQGVEMLHDHLLTFHENVFRSGVCQSCDKDCKIAVNLNTHILKHHLGNSQRKKKPNVIN